LAHREPWALEALEARANEDPFDRLASYYSAGSFAVKSSIADGLLNYFTCLSPDSLEPRTEDQAGELQSALAFCATILPDLDADAAGRFLPFLGARLGSSDERQQRLAAVAISAINSLDALQELEGEAQRRHHPVWLLAPLLERRSKAAPLALFGAIIVWLDAALGDDNASTALQDGIEKMIEADPQAAVAQIEETLLELPPAQQRLLFGLIAELGITEWSLFSDIRSFVESDASTSQLSPVDLMKALQRIYSLSELEDTWADVTSSWERLIRRMPSDPVLEQKKWNYIKDFASDVAPKTSHDRFLQGLQTVLFGKPEARRSAEFLREVQREFYEAKFRPLEGTDVAVKTVTSRLRSRVATSFKHSGRTPTQLRIPTVIYAEEAYMETLRLLIAARFPDLRIIEVPGIPWDKLDSALADNECDLGLNNDDILSYDGSPDISLFRLSGPPIYKTDDFLYLANRTFLEDNDLGQKWDGESARAHCLFQHSSMERVGTAIGHLLQKGQVSVPRDTALDTKLSEFIASLGGPVDQIRRETSDVGLLDFLTGEVEMYFGGSLQTEYALRSWKGAIPLCRFSMPLEGRLFASERLAIDYPDFMNDLAAITTELHYAFHTAVPSYRTALGHMLVRRLNTALFQSSRDNVTAVAGFDQLRDALRQSPLQECRAGSRKWERWAPTGDELQKTHLRVVGGKSYEI
jgi:hypothetical protein